VESDAPRYPGTPVDRHYFFAQNYSITVALADIFNLGRERERAPSSKPRNEDPDQTKDNVDGWSQRVQADNPFKHYAIVCHTGFFEKASTLRYLYETYQLMGQLFRGDQALPVGVLVQSDSDSEGSQSDEGKEHLNHVRGESCTAAFDPRNRNASHRQ
jgi:hypothetical protein